MPLPAATSTTSTADADAPASVRCAAPPITRPRCLLVAGPPGAGKTTALEAVVVARHQMARRVNADLIAAGLGDATTGATVMAESAARAAQYRYIAAGVDFGVETSLADNTVRDLLDALAHQRYQVSLIYLWLPDSALSVARVHSRVMRGGHGCPEGEIRRQYDASLTGLRDLCLPRVDAWEIVDASPEGAWRPIASRRHVTEAVVVQDPSCWRRILHAGGIVTHDRSPPAAVTAAPHPEPTMSTRPDDPSAPTADALVHATRALRRAQAVHKALGVPWAVWRDGAVHWIAPEDLPDLPLADRAVLPTSSAPPARDAARPLADAVGLTPLG